MASFTLKFDCDNAAFGEDRDTRQDEITRILKDILIRIEENGSVAGWVFDINGNKIGGYGIKGKDKINHVEA